ncbi:MAG: hypothetical protein K2K13_00410 [Clostridiales bacterium]|nr:hypothetical protein [Clostridiales bacterium]
MAKELKAKVFPRIWAKTTKGDKITRSYMYELGDVFDEDKLFEYVCDITRALDIPTPIILTSHKYNFVHFNIAKFLPREFVDDVDFDFFTIENSSGTIKPLPRYFNENG